MQNYSLILYEKIYKIIYEMKAWLWVGNQLLNYDILKVCLMQN